MTKPKPKLPKDILAELRHQNEAPAALRQMSELIDQLKQQIARAADEIERLRRRRA